MNIFEFDFKELSESGRDFVVRDPDTGKDTDIIVTVKGRDSKAFRKAEVIATRRRVAIDAEGKEDEVDYDEISAEVYAECIIGWKNITNEKGEEIPFNKENALMLFDRLPWFLDQVAMEVGNRPKFRSPSSQGS